MSDEPLVVCKYGWGRRLQLYRNHLDINGLFYALADLSAVQPIYCRLIGIASVRLELEFKDCTLVLRGISDCDGAERIIDYLANWRAKQSTPAPATEQAPVQDWTMKEFKAEESPCLLPVSAELLSLDEVREYDLTRLCLEEEEENGEEHEPQQSEAECWLEAEPAAEPYKKDAPSTYLEQRLQKLRAERAYRQHGFDVVQLEQALQAGTLPEIAVSCELLEGEVAHYRKDATLCSESARGSWRHRYRKKDRGLLILTNQRVIYLGRRTPIILHYEQLLHFSHSDGGIELLATPWSNPQRFTLRHPLECIMYLECILHRFQQMHVELLPQLHTLLVEQTPSEAFLYRTDKSEEQQGSEERITTKISITDLEVSEMSKTAVAETPENIHGSEA